MVASSRGTAASAEASRPGRLPQGLLAGATIAYVLWVGDWLWKFWAVLRESAPVLDMFRAEFAGPLAFEDWKTSGAVEIFCPHLGADPAMNAIGRHIDAGSVYWPAIFLFGSGIGMVGAVLMMFHGAFGQRHNSWAARSIVGLWLVAIVLLLAYSADITALTDINE